MGRRAEAGRAGLSRRTFIAVAGAWCALATAPAALALMRADRVID